jgi:hypothetical protein
MPSDILRYHAALSAHRDRFLLEHGAELARFDSIDAQLPRFTLALGEDGLPGPRTTLRLAPFLHLMHRHARNAFESLMCRQSHQAWTIVRPFVEAPLIMGKWIDDPRNAVIWMSRKSGKAARKDYRDAYTGDALRPESLPGCDVIRNLFLRLEDDFLLTSARHYSRALSFSPGAERLSDLPSAAAEDDADHRAHLCAFLHMAGFVVNATGRMLAAHFGDRPEFRFDTARLERELRPGACAIAAADDVHRNVLVHLGLWTHESLHPAP